MIMNRLLKILATGIFLSVFLTTDGLFASPGGPNRLFDVNTIISEQDITYSFELSKKPFFSLESSADQRLVLSFTQIENPDELNTKIEKLPFIHINTTGESKNTSFILAPDNIYGKIECCWLNKRSVFTINIKFNPDEEKKGKADTQPDIKDIRFGFKENGTRMVIGADNKPGWSIKYSDNNNVLLLLDAASDNINTKTYYSDKWLRQVEIKAQYDKTSELSMSLQTDPDQISIFWMPVGNRLVLDLFQDPDNQMTALLSGEKEVESRNRISKDTAEERTENEYKNIARMKIEKEVEPGDSSLEKEETKKKPAVTVPEIALDIKPALKSRLPESDGIEVDVENLSPEEAFLYGRIRQAKEINDYDMGITLSSQFLNEFKESRLCEVVSFWRADFYYDQWEKGARELGEKVILAYKYAIERFENSRNIQLSYIKMAKVASGMDDGYGALGYLGNVIIKKDPDFMPLAYLTRGKVFLQINQPEKAILDFKILLKDYENSQYGMEANLWLGNYYHQIGLYEEAEKSFNEIAQKYPGLYLEYPDFILLNAMNYIYLKKYDEARDYLFRAVNLGGQKEPLDMLLSRIGDTYHNQDNDKEAEKYYRMVIDYYPASEGASISKLRLAEFFSDITILDDISSDSTTGEAIGELAMLEKAYQLYEGKQYVEAIKTLKDIVEKPVQTETRKDAKRLYILSIEKEIERLKDSNLYKDLVYLFEENRNSINKRIDPKVLLSVAEAYNKLGRQREAVSVYSQIKLYDLNQEKRGDYIYGLAEDYIFLGDRNKAVTLLEKGRNEKIAQQDLQKINLLLADMYKLNGRNNDAEKLYNQVIENMNDLPAEDAARAYLNLGLTFKARKQYSDARNALNHSITIGIEKKISSSVLRSAYTELGNVLYSEGKHKQAAKAFEKGFEIGIDTEEPEYWDIRFRQAMAYLKTGEDSKAETLFNDISEGDANEILQQRAQLKLGSLVLARQLKILSMGQK